MPRSATHTTHIPGFRLGIYVFRDAEVLDYAAVAGVLSVARRIDPEIDVFLIGEVLRPVSTQAGISVLPSYALSDAPAIDALLLPGGPGARPEMHNRKLHDYIRSLPPSCLLASVGTGAWIYGRMGLLDGLSATSRKEADRLEASHMGKTPIDRLAEIAPRCRVSRARVVDAGRLITSSGISSGVELGLHLLRRAGHDERVIEEVVRVMEYQRGYAVYRDDIEFITPISEPDASVHAPAIQSVPA
ncbi:DJ-1/PfpI family protein [Uliginosibacterium sp. H3]|uniref:DJ-1/PfpI family protein n=1 Tax=Uliginosibacterium silvisoli TaxID=3114758 RepID=A0ABU6K0N4_9RHOO|nr:DJ-1/PfpI family protein [Uliginosibacterium sp. H3]